MKVRINYHNETYVDYLFEPTYANNKICGYKYDEGNPAVVGWYGINRFNRDLDKKIVEILVPQLINKNIKKLQLL